MHEAACSRVAYQCGQCALILPDMEAMRSHAHSCPASQQAEEQQEQPDQPLEKLEEQSLEQAGNDSLLHQVEEFIVSLGLKLVTYINYIIR